MIYRITHWPITHTRTQGHDAAISQVLLAISSGIHLLSFKLNAISFTDAIYHALDSSSSIHSVMPIPHRIPRLPGRHQM
jgi:hypothetical protein